MPTESTYPPVDIPPVDIWGLIFERKDREFPDEKGVQPYLWKVASRHAHNSF